MHCTLTRSAFYHPFISLSIRRLCVSAALLLLPVVSAQAQTPPTPDAFLGYRLGERFTPHHRLVRYVETVAAQVPDRCQLMPYGETYEGRPLMVLAVASPENRRRLEEIRTSNLKHTGLLPGTPMAEQPAVVWLSYNVHGNEAVSSEAVMQVLYELVNPADAEAQGWLRNTVVLLDPCLNPDGHERYVQWYGQVANQPYQPLPYSREHTEPWPGGRYNHYLFDLNRDWAWQTQRETQQRAVLYNAWMPHLHADFHEMGPESPYYFAPSAKPYHESLTPWQRQFQNYIGEANRKRFDKNNWLYYTRERFDLFYPSFGDTWPTFNGAIGMTYEQGGSGQAGLGLLTAEGDTLTLTARIAHHVAASRATIEAVATRAGQVVQEFKKYFDDSRTAPAGPYKGFLVKAKGQEGKVKALAELLDRNGIRYGYAAKGASVKGFAYASGKPETAAVEDNDLVISAYQPKSALLRVLFDANPKLEDSLTYDITSWAVPYAYGLDAYGLPARFPEAGLSAAPRPVAAPAAAAVARPYAYLAEWKGVRDVQFLAALLKKKIKLRNAETPFEMGGRRYEAGTLLITRAGNEPMGDAFDRTVTEQAAALGVPLVPVAGGFVDKGSDFGSDYVHFIKAPRIALVAGSGVAIDGFSSAWHFFEQQIGYPVVVVEVNRLAATPLHPFDVLVLPSGAYPGVFNDRMMAKLKEWIQEGGTVVALEDAAELLGGKPDFAWQPRTGDKPAAAKAAAPTDTLKTYADREREEVRRAAQGSVYRVTLDNTHPLAFGYGGTYYALLRNATPFALLKKDWNVGYITANGYVAGHVGQRVKANIQHAAVFGVQEMGRGRVVYLAENPLFRAFWQQGKLLFGNAVFLVGRGRM